MSLSDEDLVEEGLRELGRAGSMVEMVAKLRRLHRRLDDLALKAREPGFQTGMMVAVNEVERLVQEALEMINGGSK
jgi:hypothetical protein